MYQHKTFSVASLESTKASSSTVLKMVNYLPFRGLYLVLLTSISILSTVILVDTYSQHIIDMVTLYVGFAIVGLLDIIIFYVDKNLFPKHIDSLGIVVAFVVEYLVFSSDCKSIPVNTCFVMGIIGCLCSSAMRIFSSSSIRVLQDISSRSRNIGGDH